MASVWKRLQRVNKRAARFQYTASYHRIDLETTAKWKPTKLSVVWTRRSRRVVTDPLDWEPSLKDPLKGSVIFPVTENHSVAVTLFKDSRTGDLEDKDWTFVIEDVSSSGKRRRVASCALNMRKYASLEPSQRTLTLQLDNNSNKIQRASIQLTLHCVLLREGQATDEDMQSLASLLSVNNNSDIAVLEDLDEDDYTLSDHSTKQMLDLRQQMEEMTNSLTGSDVATPNSVQSLGFDSRTPTGSPHTPKAEPHGFTSRPEYLSSLTRLAKSSGNGQATKMEPKSTSTPNKPATVEQPKTETNIKGVVFKQKTVSKINLKPLELKTNLNNFGLDNNDNRNSPDNDKTPVNDIENVFSKNNAQQAKTPVQDLLEWCQAVTREHVSVKVNDLQHSWADGLAFCAVIHRFRPDLIDFSGLQPDEHGYVRAALAASAALGVPSVLSADDVRREDKLAIMTYLFQLRAYFTGNELQVEHLSNDDSESSYLVGRHDTDGADSRDLFTREVAARRSNRGFNRSAEQRKSDPPPVIADKPSSPTVIKDVRDMFLSQSKSILGKVLSPTRDTKPVEKSASAKWFTDPLNANQNINEPVAPSALMTRKELTDPFGSDDEEDSGPVQSPTVDSPQSGETPQSPTNHEREVTPELPKPTPQLLSRHDELKERARQLLEATKREAREKERNRRQNSKEKEEINGSLTNGDLSPIKKPMTEEERQVMLRERARKLIADARAGIVSPSSPRPRAGTVEIISKQSVLEEIAAAGGVDLDGVLSRSASDSPHSDSPVSGKGSSSERSEGRVSLSPPRSAPSSPLRALLTPDREKRNGMDAPGGYIACELQALEREQTNIDERAARLERQLRRVIQEKDEQEESRLMSQWFSLVNKKNALIRRQMQLNILEQEEDLTRRCELLARELRLSVGVDEWRKTPGQQRREKMLLQELVAAVNERDRLVQEMDEQEKAIADDDEIERNLSQVDLPRKNNCMLQ